MIPSKPMSEQDPRQDAREPYEKPAIVYEDEMEALATACVDCDLNGTKNSAATMCPATGQPCISPFSS